MKLYIDIDGVLLTTKSTQRPKYAVEFIDYIVSNFDCYWLTSHCKEGNITYLIQYLSAYYELETIEKCKRISPTSWKTAKTEAVDFNSDFYWLDDYVFEFEKNVLERNCCLDRWIRVNLNNEDELKYIMIRLKSHGIIDAENITWKYKEEYNAKAQLRS